MSHPIEPTEERAEIDAALAAQETAFLLRVGAWILTPGNYVMPSKLNQGMTVAYDDATCRDTCEADPHTAVEELFALIDQAALRESNTPTDAEPF